MASGAERGSGGVNLALILMGFVAGVVALYYGRAVFEPLAFALFIIALTAPMMQRMQPRIGKGAALIVTLLLTIAVLAIFFTVVFWGVVRVGDWVIANMARFQATYQAGEAWMQARDLPIEAFLPERFEARWILGPLGSLLAQMRLISGFALLICVFVILGLTELEGMARRLKRIEADRPNMKISQVATEVSGKFGLYMKVRLVISLIDAVVCYIFFRLIGLEEPLAWAILVGTMNFIPFIGPLIVAVFIGLFAAAQFGSLWMVVLAVGGTTAINFVLGSYIEPLMAGSKLAMSAVLVLFSVFFWAIIWGIPGAFIGVQIMVVTLAICRVVPSASWIAELFAGDGGETAEPPKP